MEAGTHRSEESLGTKLLVLVMVAAVLLFVKYCFDRMDERDTPEAERQTIEWRIDASR